MNEIQINNHVFDNAKNQIKRFSEKIPPAIKLPPVPTNSGPFDWFEHNVTGAELNKLTDEIQKQFITINTNLVNSAREFGEVYVALEALDKDYIQAIILAIKAAEEASNQAKDIAIDAAKNTKDISMTIEAQKSIIKILEKFKSKIDKYNHLEKIEEIWKDLQSLKKNFNAIENATYEYNSTVDFLKTQTSNLDKKFIAESESKKIDITSLKESTSQRLDELQQENSLSEKNLLAKTEYFREEISNKTTALSTKLEKHESDTEKKYKSIWLFAVSASFVSALSVGISIYILLNVN